MTMNVRNLDPVRFFRISHFYVNVHSLPFSILGFSSDYKQSDKERLDIEGSFDDYGISGEDSFMESEEDNEIDEEFNKLFTEKHQRKNDHHKEEENSDDEKEDETSEEKHNDKEAKEKKENTEDKETSRELKQSKQKIVEANSAKGSINNEEKTNKSYEKNNEDVSGTKNSSENQRTKSMDVSKARSEEYNNESIESDILEEKIDNKSDLDPIEIARSGNLEEHEGVLNA